MNNNLSSSQKTNSSAGSNNSARSNNSTRRRRRKALNLTNAARIKSAFSLPPLHPLTMRNRARLRNSTRLAASRRDPSPAPVPVTRRRSNYRPRANTLNNLGEIYTGPTRLRARSINSINNLANLSANNLDRLLAEIA
jgi:hypothetical protein